MLTNIELSFKIWIPKYLEESVMSAMFEMHQIR